jgi:hypothetical protein
LIALYTAINRTHPNKSGKPVATVDWVKGKAPANTRRGFSVIHFFNYSFSAIQQE